MTTYVRNGKNAGRKLLTVFFGFRIYSVEFGYLLQLCFFSVVIDDVFTAIQHTILQLKMPISYAHSFIINPNPCFIGFVNDFDAFKVI